MVENVIVQDILEPKLNKAEVLRYAGCKSDFDTQFPEECMKAVQKDLRYSVCWREFSVTPTKDGMDLGFTTINSDYAKRMLEGCNAVVVFAATVGIAVDKMIAKYAKLSPSTSLMYQALGTERVESLCDSFCELSNQRLTQSGYKLGVRFSPGYGDISLSIQNNIFSTLDVSRNIGVNLTDSLLMVPTKSVTAIAGIKKINTENKLCSVGCKDCNKTDCTFRKDQYGY